MIAPFGMSSAQLVGWSVTVVQYPGQPIPIYLELLAQHGDQVTDQARLTFLT